MIINWVVLTFHCLTNVIGMTNGNGIYLGLGVYPYFYPFLPSFIEWEIDFGIPITDWITVSGCKKYEPCLEYNVLATKESSAKQDAVTKTTITVVL